MGKPALHRLESHVPSVVVECVGVSRRQVPPEIREEKLT